MVGVATNYISVALIDLQILTISYLGLYVGFLLLAFGFFLLTIYTPMPLLVKEDTVVSFLDVKQSPMPDWVKEVDLGRAIVFLVAEQLSKSLSSFSDRKLGQISRVVMAESHTKLRFIVKKHHVTFERVFLSVRQRKDSISIRLEMRLSFLARLSSKSHEYIEDIFELFEHLYYRAAETARTELPNLMENEQAWNDCLEKIEPVPYLIRKPLA
jgi:hypothetical protein